MLLSKLYVRYRPYERVILTIFMPKKVVFWTFWKLFWRCHEFVWGLFLALKYQLVGVFSPGKVNSWARKIIFLGRISNLWEDHFHDFLAQKIKFWSFWKLFSSCSEVCGYFFWPQKAHFWLFFKFERFIINPGKSIFLRNFWHFEGVVFANFHVKKS